MPIPIPIMPLILNAAYLTPNPLNLLVQRFELNLHNKLLLLEILRPYFRVLNLLTGYPCTFHFLLYHFEQFSLKLGLFLANPALNVKLLEPNLVLNL